MTDKPTVCFFHSADLDGHSSGAIVRRAHPGCELRGINYGDVFPWDEIQGRDVIMVDFSLQPFDQMIRLKEEAASLVWIDHHKSALAEAEAAGFECDGVRNTKQAACELAWRHLLPDELMPDAVYLLGRYDVWDHTDGRTLPFQYGLRLHETVPTDTTCAEYGLWSLAFMGGRFISEVMGEGGTVLRYVEKDNAVYAGASAFATELDGLRVLAVNKGLTNSQLFDSVWDPASYDAMAPFSYRGGVWHVSLYTTHDDVDVSAVAAGRGGGGHAQAAGFQCDVLPDGFLR